MAAVGNWMRNKETGEAVEIVAINGARIEYGNGEVAGEIRADKLEERFDVLNDPTDQRDIEFLLKAKIETGDAETGLYDLGMGYVVVDRVDVGNGLSELTFQWFYNAIPFRDLLND
jgi:hypothetical protein